MRKKVLNTASRLCDTMMQNFKNAKDLPPEKLFHYHQGVFLSGMMNNYKLTGEEKYYNYIKEWVDSIIQEDGTIDTYDPTRLDDIQPGILLFPLYERTKEEKYKIALGTLIDILRTWKKNNAGGFWHKDIHPNQMWLDSLYMGGPIQAEYAVFSGETKFLDEAAEQAVIMYEHMVDEKTGLMFHAWDESKEVEWADKETGLSPEIWGRAQGWYVVAILDILQFMPENHPRREKLIEIEKEILASIMKYRDSEKKMWYQVIDKGDHAGNWIETSCSCLFTAAIAKAIYMGILDKSCTAYVNECFDAIYDSVEKKGDEIYVNKVCVGTGVKDYQGYIERPTVANDLHGVGAFLLMCAEVARVN